ncbi:hypothetical protein L9F63_006458, partial [Diploptera punctata]
EALVIRALRRDFLMMMRIQTANKEPVSFFQAISSRLQKYPLLSQKQILVL